MHFVLLYCLQINFMFMIYVLCQRRVSIPGCVPKRLKITFSLPQSSILLDTFDNNSLSVIGGRRANHAAAFVSLFTWRRVARGLRTHPGRSC